MHAKNGRRNSDFQLAYFLAGDCTTYDGAYALLREQERERQAALAVTDASMKQVQARILVARWALWTFRWLRPARLWLEGYVGAFEAMGEISKVNYEAALDELATLRRLIEKVQPFRKFQHLSDKEAFQACEWGEWEGELLRRAEDQILTQGRIRSDDFRTMRNHPAFETTLGPRLLALQKQAGGELAPSPIKTYLLSQEAAE